MKRRQDFGTMNGHNVGWAMKEMVRRSIEIIQGQLMVFEAKAKRGYDGRMNDVFTTADTASENMYWRMIHDGFPTYGLISEETKKAIRCSDKRLGDIYFTVDPLDGTKAFVRGQSDSIGTMLALVHNGKVVAVCIGDVMTREIYYYRPGSNKVHRLHAYSRTRVLKANNRKLRTQHVLLRERPEDYGHLIGQLVAPQVQGGLFKDILITGGSIGITMARLWKNEVGAMVMKSDTETPWDSAPLIGICDKLGYVFLEPNSSQDRFVLVPAKPHKTIERRSKQQLVIHKSHLRELEAWQDRVSERRYRP